MSKSDKRKSAGKASGRSAVGKTSARVGKRAQKDSVSGRFVSKDASIGESRRKSASRRARGPTDLEAVVASKGSGKLRLVAESERLVRLIDELGNNRVASLLSVSRSQPSRWRSGEEGMGVENQRKLIDLDYVFGRLEQLFPSRQAEIWLTSFNAHLGARPIDVLRLKGATPVIEAIDAEAQGAFA
jgi:hypothetical protein